MVRRKIHCKNGNTVVRFYDRSTHSSVTMVLDAEGNQVGDAAYDGNKASAAFSMAQAIKDNGGEFTMPPVPAWSDMCKKLGCKDRDIDDETAQIEAIEAELRGKKSRKKHLQPFLPVLWCRHEQ